MTDFSHIRSAECAPAGRARAHRAGLSVALLVSLASAATAGAPDLNTRHLFPYPLRFGPVTDDGDLLSTDDEARVRTWLSAARRGAGVEISVVTVRSIKDYPQMPQTSIKAFTEALGRTYAIGALTEGKGVLLVVARDDEERCALALGHAYGDLRDTDARRIIDETINPRLIDGDYAGGIRAGVQALVREFATVPPKGFNWWLYIVLPGLVVVAGLVGVDLFRHGKRGWGWIAAGVVIILGLLIAQFVVTVCRAAEKAHGWGHADGGTVFGRW